MEACYGGTDVMEKPCACAVARGKDINSETATVPTYKGLYVTDTNTHLGVTVM